jgi:hypothetical protein
MKKLFYILTAVLMLSFSSNSFASATDTKRPLTEQQQAEIQRIEQRVQEIKAMDKSQLSSQERKALRKELREMKAQARVASGGVYLSTAAIIIIILLLILIL